MSDSVVASDERPALAPAIEQALALFEPTRRPAELHAEHGYLDLLGERDPTGVHPGQRLMLSRALPLIYQRLWRPLGARLLMGVTGPGTDEEHQIALGMLSIRPGDRVLDVGCGPGNFARDFARAVGDGLVVGVDASEPMLAAAVRGSESANLAFVRGDACELPFRDRSFDAISCFAALYLIEDPMRALDEICVSSRRAVDWRYSPAATGAPARPRNQRGRAHAERGADLRVRRVDRGSGRSGPDRRGAAGDRSRAVRVGAQAAMSSLPWAR